MVTARDWLEAIEKTVVRTSAVILDVPCPARTATGPAPSQVRASTRDLPVVILTSRDQAGDGTGVWTGADF